MTKKTFIDTERFLGSCWGNLLEDSMVAAGKEEKALAIARNDLHEGVPSITVVVDGGWPRGHTNTLTIHFLKLPSLLEKKQGKFFSWE